MSEFQSSEDKSQHGLSEYADPIRALVPELPWELRPKVAQVRQELAAATMWAIAENDDGWKTALEAEESSVISEILSCIAKAAVDAARDPECSAESQSEFVAVGEWCMEATRNGLSEEQQKELFQIWKL